MMARPLDDPPAAFSPVVTQDGQYVYCAGPLESGEGAVRVFLRDLDNGHLSLVPDETQLGCQDGSFGQSVAVSGDLAVVGAPDDAAAYVYERDSSGIWTRQAEPLKAAGEAENAYFGGSVAVSGGMVVVGAPYENSAYVFTRQDGLWTQVKLTADDSQEYDQFGCSVAISGDTVIIGAEGDNAEGESWYCGSAYVFRHISGQWQQEAKLIADDGGEYDSLAARWRLRPIR